MRHRRIPFALLLFLAAFAGPALSQQPEPPPTPAPVAAPAPTSSAPEKEKKPSPGPVEVKVGENVRFRFGILLQGQADWQEKPDGGTAQNLLLRRVQLMVGGQLTKDLFFLFQTDNPRLGAVNAQGSKVISSGFQVVDAVLEWRLAKAFNLWGGMFYVPTSRDSLKGSSSEFLLDVTPYAYLSTAALQGTGGRDVGFQARGYFLDDRLEYRVGVFQGLRDPASKNAPRTVARLQYDFFDKEVYNFVTYSGGNLGKRRILAVGAAYDTQKDYHGFTADVFADLPTPFGSVIGSALYEHLDGGTFVPVALAKSDVLGLEAGAFLSGWKVGPWVRWERRDFAAPNDARGESHVLVGLNYYVFGNNLNLKAAWGRIHPKSGPDLDQFTVQLQAWYF